MPATKVACWSAKLRERRGTVIAPLQMRADRNLIPDVELAIMKRLQPSARRRAGKRSHAVLASRSSSRNDWRARVRRDLTVPIATPRENAISS